MLYDVENLLKDLNLSEKEKNQLINEVKEEFSEDEMLFELHLYRTVQFLKKSRLEK